MNNKLSALLTTAIVTGLISVQSAKAEESADQKSGDQVAAEKNNCKGAKHADKNGCKGKKKKADKNSCKNGCGESKDKKEESN